MADRVELSFKNQEVKTWFVIMTPFFLLSSSFLFKGDSAKRSIPFLLPILAWTVYYSWRYRHRKKQKKTAGKS
jgi:hypothetical protein